MIKRSVYNVLEKHLTEPEMTVLIGPRQVGKTYLMRLLQSQLDTKGEKSLFLSLDTEDHRQYFVSQAALINYLRLQVGEKSAFVFIDEIQRKHNAGLFLKGIYDMGLPYKFIASGSGSLELKEKIHESLAGRKMVFEVGPVSFAEFIHFKTEYAYEHKARDFFRIEKETVEKFLKEYMNFGGYPRVVVQSTSSDKARVIDEIYRSYLERDAVYLLKVEKIEAFSSLVKLLASQTGNIVNYSEISNTLGISSQTVKNYLWYLEKTFIVRKVSPYFRNVM